MSEDVCMTLAAKDSHSEGSPSVSTRDTAIVRGHCALITLGAFSGILVLFVAVFSPRKLSRCWGDCGRPFLKRALASQYQSFRKYQPYYACDSQYPTERIVRAPPHIHTAPQILPLLQ